MPRNRNPQRRLGALLSIEALFVLVIAFVLVLALIEFGFLMSARERVHNASREATRVAALGGSPESIRHAAKVVLGPRLGSCARIRTNAVAADGNACASGEQVTVQVSVPCELAAPNLLRFIGINLSGRLLEAGVVMRKE